MSPQETEVLQDFLHQLEQVRGVPKDPQADAMIARTVAQQPDAAYLLVQRALLLEQALNSAKTQIATLQAQLDSAQPASRRFLEPGAWRNRTRPLPRAAPMTAPGPYQGPMSASRQGASPGFLTGGMGSLLGTAAATAAGVAGGAFLFHGIEHLLDHHDENSFLGQGAGAAAEPASAPDETTNENFFSDETAVDETAADDSAEDIGGGLFDDSNPDEGLFS